MTPSDRHEPRTPRTPVADRQFLERLRAGDREAMAHFFESYYDRLFGHVAQLVRDAHLAEDLTHEIFMRLQRVLNKLDPGRDPRAWVFTVATNVVRDHWRSRRHKDAACSVGLTDEHLEAVADGSRDAEEDLVRRQEQTALRAALGELSEDDQEIILLRDYQGLDHRAVAEIIGIKVDAVRQRHSRAVARLGRAFRGQRERGGTAE